MVAKRFNIQMSLGGRLPSTGSQAPSTGSRLCRTLPSTGPASHITANTLRNRRQPAYLEMPSTGYFLHASVTCTVLFISRHDRCRKERKLPMHSCCDALIPRLAGNKPMRVHSEASRPCRICGDKTHSGKVRPFKRLPRHSDRMYQR